MQTQAVVETIGLAATPEFLAQGGFVADEHERELRMRLKTGQRGIHGHRKTTVAAHGVDGNTNHDNAGGSRDHSAGDPPERRRG